MWGPWTIRWTSLASWLRPRGNTVSVVWCFSWRHSRSPDYSVTLPGFGSFRADRDVNLREKRKCGGTALCGDETQRSPGYFTIKRCFCGLHVDLLAVDHTSILVAERNRNAAAIWIQFKSRSYSHSSIRCHRGHQNDCGCGEWLWIITILPICSYYFIKLPGVISLGFGL